MTEGRPQPGFANEQEVRRLFSHLTTWLGANCLLEFSPQSRQLGEHEEAGLMVIVGDRPKYSFEATPKALDRRAIAALRLDVDRPISLVSHPECFASEGSDVSHLEHLPALLRVTTHRADAVLEVSEALVFEAQPPADACRLLRIRRTSLGADSEPRFERLEACKPSERAWLTTAEAHFLGSLAATLFIEDPAVYTYQSSSG